MAHARRPPEEVPAVRELRRRNLEEGGLFWTDDGELCVFDPEAAQRINAANFADLTLPDRLVDVLRGRQSRPVSWKSLRTAWTAQLRTISGAAGVEQLAARMKRLLEGRLGPRLDLVWTIQQVCTRALVPVVIDGLTARDAERVLRDQDMKLARLVKATSAPKSRWMQLQETWIQVAAGLAVRRELRGRARGRRPRRSDMTDPVVDMLPELGMDRAVDAVTTVLTAIAGPPGAAAAALLYELTTRPDWEERLTSELCRIPPDRLYAAPLKAAPVTHRFVKEVLRVWSPPLLMTRPVRTEMELGGIHLEPGQRYILSTFSIHHDPRHWEDPERFDPDRWLPGEDAQGCPYVPFGWSPKSCLGAGLGTVQMILLAWLACTRFRVRLADPEGVGMLLAAVPLPTDFEGTIERRTATI